jgi:uncharacterized protein DUF4252
VSARFLFWAIVRWLGQRTGGSPKCVAVETRYFLAKNLRGNANTVITDPLGRSSHGFLFPSLQRKEIVMSAICFMTRSPARVAASASLLLVALVARPVLADDDTEKRVVGRVDFESADLPPANIEVDLSQGMFNDLFGIGDAAIAGIADTLSQNSDANKHPDATRMAAEQLQAARQIFELAGDVVHEVRIRGYEAAPEGVVSHFDNKIGDDWETLVRVRKDDENARVSLLRQDGAVRGVFVIATDGNGLIIVNAVCDISPENVKKLTTAATRIGLENGLAQQINEKMQKMNHRLPPPAQDAGSQNR